LISLGFMIICVNSFVWNNKRFQGKIPVAYSKIQSLFVAF
jgi:hypothetical protein